MGAKTQLKYLSSAKRLPDSHIPWLPLILMQASETEAFHFMPKLDNERLYWTWLPFSRWWEEDIFKTADGEKLSRMNLVSALRSQDGGSHIDEELTDTNYVALKLRNDPRVRRSKSDPAKKPRMLIFVGTSPLDDTEPIPNAHLATMRQIAWELRQSINRVFAI